jgi:hypothetical protein
MANSGNWKKDEYNPGVNEPLLGEDSISDRRMLNVGETGQTPAGNASWVSESDRMNETWDESRRHVSGSLGNDPMDHRQNLRTNSYSVKA